jgi:hypothetical protein
MDPKGLPVRQSLGGGSPPFRQCYQEGTLHRGRGILYGRVIMQAIPYPFVISLILMFTPPSRFREETVHKLSHEEEVSNSSRNRL